MTQMLNVHVNYLPLHTWHLGDMDLFNSSEETQVLLIRLMKALQLHRTQPSLMWLLAETVQVLSEVGARARQHVEGVYNIFYSHFDLFLLNILQNKFLFFSLRLFGCCRELSFVITDILTCPLRQKHSCY